MPASLFADMDRNSGLEGQRALQLALELSMLGLNNENEDGLGSSSYDGDNRNKKSQNMTECVPVPSSEHVAEIVGRQGCKIKALRAKTNTYIKTPVRGEEPVFVVTGRKEDVNMAKREILSAAEHFSQIRASRKNNMNGSLAPGPPNNVPGQTTIQVRVPYRVVGLVVGPKGATIKRIQQQTHTYIVTPSRDKEPVFEVTGLPDNVDNARKEIEAHIAMRTGGMLGDGSPGGGDPGGLGLAAGACDFLANGLMDQAFSSGSSAGSSTGNDMMSSLYKSGGGTASLNALNSAFSFCDSNNIMIPRNQEPNIFNFAATNGGSKMTDFGSSAFGGGGGGGFGLYDTDEGISESPTYDPNNAPPTPSSMWPDLNGSCNLFRSSGTTAPPPGLGGAPGSSAATRRSSSVSGPPLTPRLSPTLCDVGEQHPPARRLRSDPIAAALASAAADGALLSGFAGNGTSSSSAGSPMSSSPTDSLGSGGRNKNKLRDCVVCFECEVVAALVPCGHNLFCMECANRLCGKDDPLCPVCHRGVTQAIRIYS